jgi:DNA-binding MarR family transcriptional regulator
MGTKIKKSSSSREMAERIILRIYQCDNLVHRTAAKALEEFNLSSQQWMILGSLGQPDTTEGLTVGDLADLLRVSRQSLTATLSRLETRNLIERTVCSGDARARRVQLTREGAKIYKDLQGIVNEYYVHALDGFSFDDHVNILHYFNRLLSSLSKI